jgi:hypothetical protein
MANKVTIELGSLERALSALAGIASQSMSAKHAFCVAKAIRVMDAEARDMHEARRSLFNKYGKVDEQGNPVLKQDGNVDIDDSKYKDFEKEILSLYETEVEIDIPVLKFEWFESLQFSPSEVLALMPLFADAEDIGGMEDAGDADVARLKHITDNHTDDVIEFIEE